MLSRIPLRHKMAKNKYQNFYQCKKVIGLLYNLESGKKRPQKSSLSLQKFYKLSAFSGFQLDKRLHAFCGIRFVTGHHSTVFVQCHGTISIFLSADQA